MIDRAKIILALIISLYSGLTNDGNIFQKASRQAIKIKY
jgi:hypothetical protein